MRLARRQSFIKKEQRKRTQAKSSKKKNGNRFYAQNEDMSSVCLHVRLVVQEEYGIIEYLLSTIKIYITVI